MPKVESPRRGRYAQSAIRNAVGESASFTAAIARLPFEGPVAHDTLLAWESNGSNDGYPQGHWNPVTDPGPTIRERLSQMSTVTWGQMKVNFIRMLEQATAVLPRRRTPSRLLAPRSPDPVQAAFEGAVEAVLLRNGVKLHNQMTWGEVIVNVIKWSPLAYNAALALSPIHPWVLMTAIGICYTYGWDWRFVKCILFEKDDHKTCSYRHRIKAVNSSDLDRQEFDYDPQWQEILRRAQNSTFAANTDPLLILVANMVNETANLVAPEFLQPLLHSFANVTNPVHGIPHEGEGIDRPYQVLMDGPSLSGLFSTSTEQVPSLDHVGTFYQQLGAFQAVLNAGYLAMDSLTALSAEALGSATSNSIHTLNS